jgi:hypothetical protein
MMQPIPYRCSAKNRTQCWNALMQPSGMDSAARDPVTTEYEAIVAQGCDQDCCRGLGLDPRLYRLPDS